MKKKIIILIGILFLLCGCTAEVNLEISGNTISESVDIVVYQSVNYSKNQIQAGFRKYVPIYSSDVIVDTNPDEPVSGIQYYTKTETDLGNGYKINYKYDFPISRYQEARSIKEGFRSSSIQVNQKEKTILISTDKNGLLYFEQYPDLEEVKVNIKTSYSVKESNADSVNDNVYTWVLKKGNPKNIYLLLNTEKQDTSNQPSSEKTNSQTEEEDEVKKLFNEHPYLVALLAMLLFLFIVFVGSKIKKMN